jgi:hypothetical protein
VSDAGVAGPTLIILGGLFLFWSWLGWSTQKSEDAHPPDPNARVTARWSERGRSYSGELHVARSEYLRRYRRHSVVIAVALMTSGLLVILAGALL